MSNRRPHADEPRRPEVASARDRAAQALRDVAELFASRRLGDDLYSELETTAQSWASTLRTADERLPDHRKLRAAFFPDDCPDGAQVSHFRHCFVNGSTSPIAMGLRAYRSRDEVHAAVQFGRLYQGAPGRVHGGALAAAFDDVTSLVLNIHRVPAFTALLTISYRRPVPIEVPVSLRAGLVDRSSRKLIISATAIVEDQVAAEAEAMFVVVTEERWITGREERPKR